MFSAVNMICMVTGSVIVTAFIATGYQMCQRDRKWQNYVKQLQCCQWYLYSKINKNSYSILGTLIYWPCLPFKGGNKDIETTGSPIDKWCDVVCSVKLHHYLIIDVVTILNQFLTKQVTIVFTNKKLHQCYKVESNKIKNIVCYSVKHISGTRHPAVTIHISEVYWFQGVTGGQVCCWSVCILDRLTMLQAVWWYSDL